MKLDVNQLRYLSTEEFRVLTAVEMGMKNHDIVPTIMIQKIASLRFGGVKKCLSELEKLKLVHHDNKKYDGYYLTYPGYDFLSLKTFVKRGTIAGVGRQIGVGKESDIYMVVNDEDEELVLKCQRLGRVHNKNFSKFRHPSVK
jgi:RIO kinase 2